MAAGAEAGRKRGEGDGGAAVVGCEEEGEQVELRSSASVAAAEVGVGRCCTRWRRPPMRLCGRGARLGCEEEGEHEEERGWAVRLAAAGLGGVSGGGAGRVAALGFHLGGGERHGTWACGVWDFLFPFLLPVTDGEKIEPFFRAMAFSLWFQQRSRGCSTTGSTLIAEARETPPTQILELHYGIASR